jgi:prolyl oligopeptidase
VPAAALAPEVARAGGPPSARTVDARDEFAGRTWADPYRWMEGPANAEFISWLEAQGQYAAQELARLPGRQELLVRVRELGLGTSIISSPVRVADKLFYSATPAGAQVARLMVRDPDGTTRVLIDPATLVAGGHASVDNFNPSPDGRFVAYNLNPGGSEITSIHVLPTDGGAELPDTLERVWGEFAATWLPDGSGFFYTQMAEPVAGVDPMFNKRARLHRLGTPVAKDPAVLGHGIGNTMTFEPQEFTVAIRVPLGSSWMIARGGGARPEQRIAVARLSELDSSGAGNTPWKIVAGYEDAVRGGSIHGDRLYLLSHKGAPHRRILSVPLERPHLAEARVEVDESEDASIEDFAFSRDALYLHELVGGHARVRRRPWRASALTTVELPYAGSIDNLSGDPRKDGVVLDLSGWTQPTEILAYDPGSKQLSATGLGTTTPADPRQFLAEELEIASKDGARVPLSVLQKKDLGRDGSHPTIVFGYGGYGVPLTPWFSPSLMAWLERGGVFAVCHVRGGGEKGEAWHEAGVRNHKQNGVDDFIACGEHLVRQGYTSPARLAAQGASMGGVLIGRALTERPELFAAALIGVGILNPLRIVHAENGANQLAELGSPDTDTGLRGLIEMDPYLHVAPGVAYPAVLFTVGLHDARVSPWMTGKMAARLQASSSSGRPVLVRVDADAGHGIGSTRDQVYAERADQWSFLLAAFKDPAFTPK